MPTPSDQTPPWRNPDQQTVLNVIRRAAGRGEYDTVALVLPQFERPEGEEDPWLFPEDAEALDVLKDAPFEVLYSMGLRQFEPGFWLYPGEWYEHIPEGYEVESILGETEAFEKGTTDDDTRAGCLPYGFKREPR